MKALWAKIRWFVLALGAALLGAITFGAYWYFKGRKTVVADMIETNADQVQATAQALRDQEETIAHEIQAIVDKHPSGPARDNALRQWADDYHHKRRKTDYQP